MAVVNASMQVVENHSPVSSPWRYQDRSATRTSSILQMWRELERERVSSCPPRNDGSNDPFESKYLSEAALEDGMSNVSRVDDSANECERVRIVREWIEMTTQQKDTCHVGREEQNAEIGTQIEQIRGGLVSNDCEVGGRRTIRWLCGRQALLDLIARSERERKRELQILLEHRPVSDFAHRNRIQSLLKGRFLRNGSFVEDKRPTSVAASELGLLRQRPTVSGLREGFLSRLENYVPSPRTQSDTSANNELTDYRDEQTQTNSMQDIPDEISDEFEHTNMESDVGGSLSDELESGELEDTDTHLQEFTAQAERRQEQIMENEETELLRSAVEFNERRDHVVEDLLGADGHVSLPQVHEIPSENDDSGDGEQGVNQVSGIIDSLQSSIAEDYNWQEESAQVEEWQGSIAENDENDWHQLARVEFGEVMGEYAHESSNGWYQEIEGNDLQESHENDLEETTHNWLDGPSHQEVAPVGMINTHYSSFEDNGYSLELRELLSRRRVSNLLQSGFRESLDQMIQSYLERQGHASDEWDPDRESPSPSARELPGQGQELQRRDEDEDEDVDYGEAAERTENVLLPLPDTPPQTSLNLGLHGTANWQRSSLHQSLEIEWEIINDLRIDMFRLQQRMNNMQGMLEACMDMQLELQRSVRQEVSAALNRSSATSAEACEDCLLKNEGKWSHVRKGICCICCDKNIDSLLYRCGHMCACTGCAEKLVKGREKCPMCHAPVLEVVRAYSIN